MTAIGTTRCMGEKLYKGSWLLHPPVFWEFFEWIIIHPRATPQRELMWLDHAACGVIKWRDDMMCSLTMMGAWWIHSLCSKINDSDVKLLYSTLLQLVHAICLSCRVKKGIGFSLLISSLQLGRSLHLYPWLGNQDSGFDREIEREMTMDVQTAGQHRTPETLRCVFVTWRRFRRSCRLNWCFLPQK